MPWNNSTSSPSGVVISITRGMVLGIVGPCRRRPRGFHYQPGDWSAGFQTQFRADDLGLETHGGQHALDVLTRMAVPAVRADGVPGTGRGVRQLLDGEH